MFTGIIQNLGRVTAVSKHGKMTRLAFQFSGRQKQTEKGESIAINGVCLTAIRIDSRGFEADLLPETLSVTNLGSLCVGDDVNLERSLRAGDAIGGHFVTGHVDAVGKIAQILDRGGNWSLLVDAPRTIISKLAVKGSVACDGVSLTLQEVTPKSFRVAVIPHTLKVTTLGRKKVGDQVNLEIDMLMRYQDSFSKKQSRKKKLTLKELKMQGF